MPGFIIYKGPSKIDGSPIVVVAVKASSNPKTGDMIQTYILQDNGKSPMENSREGLDYSICGDCKHRGTPAPDKEAGQRTTCNDCKLCSGQGIKAKSIAIPAHGIGRAYA